VAYRRCQHYGQHYAKRLPMASAFGSPYPRVA
jgi:hypothetical protein